MGHYFGQNLKTLRVQKKLSQAELGKELNKGQKTIGNWETGYSEPCLDDLIQLSHLFDINIDSLVRQEIKTDNPKAKAGRNRHKENGQPAEKIPVVISDVKRALQKTGNQHSPAEQGELMWRDKYIAVLEHQLTEATTCRVSEETVQDLMSQVIAIQKMVAEFTGGVSAT